MKGIKTLAKKLEVHQQPSGTKIISDRFSLSPIQHMFFNNVLISGDSTEKQFYNQSYLFDFNRKISKNRIENCLYELISHHDSLRLRFEKDDYEVSIA
jgi:hypothetical protein